MGGPSRDRAVVVLSEGPRLGVLETMVALHGAYYGRAWGFGGYFQAKVERELAEFLGRYDPNTDRLFLALDGERIVGSLVVDGGEPTVAALGVHLRWFIVDEACRGAGVGRRLIDAAMAFINDRYNRCYLTTFAGLDPARALYERAGFRLVLETEAESWGNRVVEQRFEFIRA